MSNAHPGSNGVALYYPYIGLHDKSWLFGALCLWETVRRIVPKGMDVEDDAWLAPLTSEGLVKPSDSHNAREAAKTRFLQTITPAGIEAPASGEQAVSLLRRRFGGPETDWTEYMGIAHIKMENDLWALLTEAGLVRPSTGEFFTVQRAVGELYMTCLATAMSDGHTPLITDQARFVDWSRALTSMRSGAEEPLLAEVAALSLDWPDTTAFVDVTPEAFLEFHGSTGAARGTFRGLLLQMRAERDAAKSPEQDEDVVERFKREFKAAHEEVLAKAAELGVKKRASALALAASAVRPWSIPDRLLDVGKVKAERRTALAQMYKNPGHYVYLVGERWL